MSLSLQDLLSFCILCIKGLPQDLMLELQKNTVTSWWHKSLWNWSDIAFKNERASSKYSRKTGTTVHLWKIKSVGNIWKNCMQCITMTNHIMFLNKMIILITFHVSEYHSIWIHPSLHRSWVTRIRGLQYRCPSGHQPCFSDCCF